MKKSKRSRADFKYKIGQWNGYALILIVDQDVGSLSVTNDIENVVADIANKESIDPKDYTIVYRDSQGYWDGWDPVSQSFFHFRTSVVNPAVQDALKQLTF